VDIRIDIRNLEQGGAWGEGHTYACDNDGFGCYMYNKQAFDDVPRVLSESGRDLVIPLLLCASVEI
jgi:hypothetical protein